MGSSQTRQSPFTVSQELIVQVREERLLQLSDVQTTVSLAYATQNNPFRHLYTIVINPTIPSYDCSLIVVFPQHPIQKLRTLFTHDYRSMADLGREINQRIIDTRQPWFHVLSGDCVFRIEGFTGTMYLVWCKRVRQTNHNNHTEPIATMMPAICEMDGDTRCRNFVLLDSPNRKARVLPVASLTINTSHTRVIWSFERTRDTSRRINIATLTEDETLCKATATIMDVVVVVPPLQPMLATDSDGEEGDEQLHFVAETPRIDNPLY